jgi:3-oxoacyl-[acyl-carrier protein] reductase
MEVQGKTALVTGASRGIGKVIAQSLGSEGANVVINARDRDDLQKTATEIESFGSKAHMVIGDLREENTVKQLVQESKDTFGGIDILINNAGLGLFHPVIDMPTKDWDHMFDLNVKSLFLMTRESLPLLRKAKESVIVNVVSLAGKNAFKGGGGYSATKHAVLAFSRCLMLEERDKGVRVLAICPGSVDTSFSDHDEEKKKKILSPKDVADSVMLMIKLPQRAMVSEIDIRPSNP